MSTEPSGYYSATNEDATTGRTNASSPKGIVRVPCTRTEEAALQKLIAHTGCTLSEIVNNTATLLYSPNDDLLEASCILHGRNLDVNPIARHR